MPFYHHLGKLPPKRHIQFRQPDGRLYKEEVMGTKGFSGKGSILYHIYPPTQVNAAQWIRPWSAPVAKEEANHHRHLETFRAKEGKDPIEGRMHWLINEDVAIATVSPTEPMPYFFRNSDGDEIILKGKVY